MSPGPTGKWRYTVLHRFKGPDGFQPGGGLIADPQGNLYGATQQCGSAGYGVVFEFTF
jgi:hypothetical protein